MSNGTPPPAPTPAPPSPAPLGAFVAGMVFFAVGVLFLMAIVLINIFLKPIPCASHMPIIFILALVIATGSTFTVSYATLNGNIPIPVLQNHAIVTGVGGGFAMFMLVFLLGPTVWPCPARELTIRITLAAVNGPNPSNQMLLNLKFEYDNIPKDARMKLSIGSDKRFTSALWVEDESGWQSGEVTTAIPTELMSQLKDGFFVKLRAEAGQESAEDVYQNRVRFPTTNPG